MCPMVSMGSPPEFRGACPQAECSDLGVLGQARGRVGRGRRVGFDAP